MGFFTDIIGDSQRPVGPTASAASLPVTPAETRLTPAINAPQRPLAPRDSRLSQTETAEKTFWEEDFRQSGATGAAAQPSTLEDRQVVGPSLSENTEDSDLAKAPEKKRSFPVIEKQKQAGLKNRRAVTVQMNRDQNLHGSVSFGRENSTSKDSSVVESAAKHPEQSARGKSVDVTHRSRQAGQITRAGATTPPNSSGAVLGPPPDSLAGEPRGKAPLAKQDQQRQRLKTGAEMLVAATERPAAQAAGQETSPLPTPPNAEAGESRMRPTRPAPEAEGAALVSKISAMPPVTEAAPLPSSVEVRFHEDPAPQAPLDGRLSEPAAEAAQQKPRAEASGPKVHIGLLEVVVLAPEKPSNRRTAPREGQNLASRHYLRNL